MNDKPPICDYEGSNYRTRFWEGQGRDYEDQVERIALRHFMPPTGRTLIDIGAGFGRLADEYDGYEKVVLFDYSRSLLQEARQRLGDDGRFIYVAGSWYDMPFVTGLFDTMVQVRTIHHAAEVPRLFKELRRIGRPGGDYVLEFANKQNLKAVLRYAIGRQNWSPFQPDPVEFVELNFNFNPGWIRHALQEADFVPGKMRTVSHYRIPLLKKVVPTSILVQMDKMAQQTGNWWQLSPSVFVHSHSLAGGESAAPDSFFACPNCMHRLAEPDGELIRCLNEECAARWAIRDGIYDFKAALPSQE